MGQTINIINADRFGEQRAIAMTEANIAASVLCVMAPAAVSLCVKCGFGWRVALLLPIVHFLVLFVFMRRTPVPEYTQEHDKAVGSAKLPLAYWGYWTVMLLMVGCEWSLIFWSAEFLQNVGHLSKSDASQAVSVFLMAMLTGRIAGSRLSRFISTSVLLRYASVTALVGFSIFWLGGSALLNLVGLFITGLGVANFYPLTLASAIAVVPNRSQLQPLGCR